MRLLARGTILLAIVCVGLSFVWSAFETEPAEADSRIDFIDPSNDENNSQVVIFQPDNPEGSPG